VFRDLGSRMPFLLAAALMAAAVGDPLVETISNTGILGRGYSDNNHLSVIPALIAGGAWALAIVCKRCLELVRNPSERRDWLIDMARSISVRSPLQDVPCVLVLQCAVLFAMESSEQLIAGGRLLGGTAWLGGPIWFSALTHVLLGSLCTLLIARGTRAILRRCAAFVAIALEFIFDAFVRGNSGVFAFRRDSSPFRCNQMLHVHQLGERAPPLFLPLA
jgi:hypothetical protein